MFIINGLQHYPAMSVAPAGYGNYSLPINNITHHAEDFIKQADAYSETMPEAAVRDRYGAHDMAYSAHRKKVKRSILDNQYSAQDCRKARKALRDLLEVVVYRTSTWGMLKSQVEELQEISKSTDCYAIR